MWSTSIPRGELIRIAGVWHRSREGIGLETWNRRMCFRMRISTGYSTHTDVRAIRRNVNAVSRVHPVLSHIKSTALQTDNKSSWLHTSCLGTAGHSSTHDPHRHRGSVNCFMSLIILPTSCIFCLPLIYIWWRRRRRTVNIWRIKYTVDRRWFFFVQALLFLDKKLQKKSRNKKKKRRLEDRLFRIKKINTEIELRYTLLSSQISYLSIEQREKKISKLKKKCVQLPRN